MLEKSRFRRVLTNCSSIIIIHLCILVRVFDMIRGDFHEPFNFCYLRNSCCKMAIMTLQSIKKKMIFLGNNELLHSMKFRFTFIHVYIHALINLKIKPSMFLFGFTTTYYIYN